MYFWVSWWKQHFSVNSKIQTFGTSCWEAQVCGTVWISNARLLKQWMPKIKPTFKKYPSITIWQVLLCSRDLFFFCFYAWRSTSLPVLEEVNTSEILQKDKDCILSAVQLHISKLHSSQLPEGFAVARLLSSCALFSKLHPGSKTSHVRPGFQNALKYTGICNMFWKLLYSSEPGATLSLQVWLSWSSRSSDNAPSFQPSQEGLSLIHSESHWEMMVVLKTHSWQQLPGSSRYKFTVIPPSL